MESIDGDDRISSLPDEILIHILSFLPVKPSVRTSILSIRWRDMWKFNPVIDFSDLPSYSPVIEPNYDPNIIPDYSFVSRCLQLYRPSKLKRFAVHRNTYDLFREFEQWVLMAAAKHVEELQLTFSFCEHTDMTPALFAARNVKILHLSGVSFDSSYGFNYLVLLKDLCIEDSALCDEVVEGIVSSCPFLENLTLQTCLGLYKVKIAGPFLRLKHLVFAKNQNFVRMNGLQLEAPNLAFFKYDGWIVHFRLKHLHCLSQVDLCFKSLKLDVDGNPSMDCTEIAHLKTAMDQLSQVKILHVTTWFVKFIVKAYDTTGNRWLAFQNLKRFSWSGMLKTREDLFALVAFLGDCPSLEFLKMELEYEEPEIRVGCLHRLRKIELHRCKGRPCEMELIKLLLENAVVLDTLSVNFASCVSELLTEELIEQVSLYPRGSSQAQVIFCKENST